MSRQGRADNNPGIRTSAVEQDDCITPVGIRPKDATHTMRGSYYKVGRFNRIYIWIGDGWYNSAQEHLHTARRLTDVN